VVRCRNRNGRIEHFKDPVYHDSPGGKPSLVYTDFGLDLLRETRELGFHPSIRRPHICVDFAYRSCVIVCRRHT
jgi:hypothetical protein